MSPQATAVVLGAAGVAKAKPGGVKAQLTAAAKHTGWPESCEDKSFRSFVWGPAHDGLDAYLAAWVAALHPGDRTALGSTPDDVIWVPAIGAAV